VVKSSDHGGCNGVIQKMIKTWTWKRRTRKTKWAQGKGIDHMAILFDTQDTIEGVSDLGSIAKL